MKFTTVLHNLGRKRNVNQKKKIRIKIPSAMDKKPPPILTRPEAGAENNLITPFTSKAIPPPNRPAPAVKIETQIPKIAASIPTKTPNTPLPIPSITGYRNTTSIIISAQRPAPLLL